MPVALIPALPPVVTNSAGMVGGISLATMIYEGAPMTPKELGGLYVSIAKSCYTATGSKRLSCGVAAIVCGGALIPGAHSIPFFGACAAILRGTNNLS